MKLIDPKDHLRLTADKRNRAYYEEHLLKVRMDHEIAKNSYFQRIVEVWNLIPLRLRKLSSYQCFSKRVMKLIRERKVYIQSTRIKPK